MRGMQTMRGIANQMVRRNQATANGYAIRSFNEFSPYTASLRSRGFTTTTHWDEIQSQHQNMSRAEINDLMTEQGLTDAANKTHRFLGSDATPEQYKRYRMGGVVALLAGFMIGFPDMWLQWLRIWRFGKIKEETQGDHEAYRKYFGEKVKTQNIIMDEVAARHKVQSKFRTLTEANGHMEQTMNQPGVLAEQGFTKRDGQATPYLTKSS